VGVDSVDALVFGTQERIQGRLSSRLPSWTFQFLLNWYTETKFHL